MKSVLLRAATRTPLCAVRARVGVRYITLDEELMTSSSQEGVVPLSLEEMRAQAKEKAKRQREEDRERLLGGKKAEDKAGARRINKEIFQEVMRDVIAKKVDQKAMEKAKRDNPDVEYVNVEYTDDEKEFLEAIAVQDMAELKQEKGENDDDFWERKSLANLRKYDYLHANLKPGRKPGRDYLSIAKKLQIQAEGIPKIPYYMRYQGQPDFIDEQQSLLKPTRLEDVKENEMAIKYEDKKDNSKDYASNIQKMYNRVQKFKEQRALEEDAMGIEPVQPKIKNSKFTGQDRICGAAILERYPTLTPPYKPWEQEHEDWQQQVRLQTCRPVIPWYVWKMEWEKLTEAQKQQKFNKPGKDAGGGGGGGGGKKKVKAAAPAEEGAEDASKKKRRGDKSEDSGSKGGIIQPPDWGLPKITLPELSPEEALERSKSEARRLKPYNDWIEYWKNWQPAPRETEDDLKDNRKSTNRELAKKLYLIVKKNRNDHSWVFPTVENTESETIRQTAERSLKNTIGRNVTVYFHSNAPCGFYKYYYDSEKVQEKYKAEANKVFFLRARFFNGDIEPNKKNGIVDYLWVTREQLKEYFTKEYYDRAIQFIWPDPN